MSSVKWIQGVVISVSLLLGACGGGGGDDDNTSGNSAPTATITSPANGSIYPQGSDIAFTGTGSDTEDGTLGGASLEWSSNADGQLGTGTTVSDMLSTGTHTMSLKVTDSDGATDTDTITVMVNAAPVISNVAVNPDSVNTGTSTTFSWSISDADGGDTLTCTLDVDADGTDDYTIGDCANNTVQTHTYTQAGNYQVRFTVSDGVNTAVQQSVNVTAIDAGMGDNVSPLINSFDATPDVPNTGDSVTFGWNVSDADGDTLTCKLDVDADGTDDYTIDNCADNTSQAHTYTQAGDYQVRLTVEDGANSPVQETVSLSVLAVTSAPPVIEQFTVGANPAYSTVATTFYWQVSDPNGDTLTCRLDVDGDGTDDYTVDDCVNSASQAHAYASAGEYTVRLTVSDGVNDDVQATLLLPLVVKPHLLLDVTVNGPVSADGRALYTITVSNVSAVPVNEVWVQFRVPSALQFHNTIDAEPNATSCGTWCESGEEAWWELATLAAGESRTITINAPVLPGVLSGSLISVPVHVFSPDVIDQVNVTKTVAVNNDLMSQLAMSASKDPVMPGESLNLQFSIGNINTTALDNLELRTRLPAGVTVNTISDGGMLDGATGEIVWAISSLAVANTIQREVAVTVSTDAIAGQILTARAELRHDGGVALDASAEHAVTVVTSTFPLTVDISASPDPVIAGGRLLYEITVSNTSAVPVNTVWVQLRVPSALQFHNTIDAEPNATSCGTWCESGEEAWWELATLAAGESRTITINSPVLPGVVAGSLISVPVRVFSPDVIDQVNVTKIVAVNNSPMSQLAMSASKDPVMPGESLNLQFSIGNINTTALDNLELRTRLPAGVTVNTISDGGILDGATGEIVWDIVSLAVGNTIQREVSVTVSTDAIAGQILTTRAELRHDGGVALDTSVEHAVTVVTSTFPLTVDISASPDPVIAGGRLLYEITVSNTSAVPVNEVWVQFRVPSALQFHNTIDAEPNATSCGTWCESGEEAWWELATLAAGESRTITINSPVLPGVLSGSLISVPVRVFSPDVIDQVNVTKTVAVNNDLMSQLAMSASKDPVMPGESLNYQFTVGNIDATALNNLELRATLPAGVAVDNISDGGMLDGATGEIVWAISSLAVANTAQREVTVTVSTDAIAGQILAARAELRHDGGVALDTSAEHAVTVVTSTFPLTVDISASPDLVIAGGRLLYEITVSNTSAVPVNEVWVQFRVPSELQFHNAVDAEPNATSCGTWCESGEEAWWELTTLAAGESRTITINSSVLPGVVAGSLISVPVRVFSSDVIDQVNRINITAVGN